ncbi:MAG: PP2C family protein-serine/threonine phosphatase [Phycisphaerales bacterium]
MTALTTSDFRPEFESELDDLRRRRFVWWLTAWIGFWLLLFLAAEADGPSYVGALVAVFAWRLTKVEWFKRPEAPLSLAFWSLAAVAIVVQVGGTLQIITFPSSSGLFITVFSFSVACLFIPWTPQQALRSALTLWIIWSAGVLLRRGMSAAVPTLFLLFGGACAFAPGVLYRVIALSRLGRRFEARVLDRFFESYQRELVDARQVHAAIFPEPRRDGPLRFNYRDNPRLGIGGDYLHASFDRNGALNLVLLDVAGDGIGAALTVNRLHGEIERVFAERAILRPDQIIDALDRYVRLTMSEYGQYAVAMAFRIRRNGQLEWSGAGHAPAYIRREDGSVERLISTTWTLGASDDRDSLQGVGKAALGPRDTLVAMTDGACERIGLDGDRLGFVGIERLLEELPGENSLDWPDEIIHRLEVIAEEIDDECTEDVLVVVATAPGRAPRTTGDPASPRRVAPVEASMAGGSP